MNPDPRDISSEFWALIERAAGDRTKMGAVLDQLTREEIIVFHRQFFDAAMAIATHEYIQYMGPNTSEDGADDISRWVVGQGRQYYLEVYDHPHKMPSYVAPHSNGQVYYEIPKVFQRRFEEDVWDIDWD